MEIEHKDHRISLVQKEIVSYTTQIVAGKVIAGDVYESAIIGDTFLYCETCDVEVTGPEVGADEHWDVV